MANKNMDENSPETHVVISSNNIQLSSIGDHSNVVKCDLDMSRDSDEPLINEYHQYLPTNADNQDSLVTDEKYNTIRKRKRIFTHMNKYNQDDLNGALEDLKYSKDTLRQVAKRWQIPKSTLSLSARMAGIFVEKKVNFNYTQDTMNAAIKAIKDGASYDKVSKDFNIPKTVIWRRCQKEGFRKSEKRNYTKSDVEEAKESLIQGKTLAIISKESKLPKPTLFRLKEQLIKDGLLPSSSIVRVKRPQRSVAHLNNLQLAVTACQVEGLSQNQASEKYQVPKSSVWRHLKRVKEEKSKNNEVEPKLDIDCPKLKESSSNSSRNNDATDKPSCEGLVLQYDGSHKVNNEPSSEKQSRSENQFDLDMPLVSFSSNAYHVIGREIVVDGQQMVVLEPSSPSQEFMTSDIQGSQNVATDWKF